MKVAEAARAGTVAEKLGATRDILREAGCDTPELDADLLVADALGVDRAALLAAPERELGRKALTAINERVRRRARREPVAYILGRRWFRDIELRVDPRVLIPRPETELLVEVALELPPGARVHDVGTGSGAVALALKHERPDLTVSASDASATAVASARENAARLGLAVEVSVESGLPAGDYDLVVANLPYVGEAEWPDLVPEIARYEPRAALVAGPSGLEAIEALVGQGPAGASLALEHAPWQAERVRDLLAEARTLRDLADRERVTIGSRA
jgi:release factor glutamine methyltransferase